MKNFSFFVVAAMIFGSILTSCDKNDLNLNEYTVYFNCNNGSDVPSQNVKEGEKVTKPINPTRSGYTFVAWFKEVELTNEWKFDIDVVISDVTLCAKWIELTGEKDPMYPATIYCLPEGTLLQMRNDFAQRNPNVYSTLNQFGFCANGYGGGYSPPDGFTEEEAIAVVKEFVARNPEYTGVNSPDDLQFRSTYSPSGIWYIWSENQAINNIEVTNTAISFRVQSKQLVFCAGNHFIDVYVPKIFNFSLEQAKSQLLGKEIIHLGWGGPYSAGIVTENHLQQSTAKLIIIPLTTDTKIEIRVAWQIYLDSPLHYIFEIDVMTGEIIRERPTIIS